MLRRWFVYSEGARPPEHRLEAVTHTHTRWMLQPAFPWQILVFVGVTLLIYFRFKSGPGCIRRSATSDAVRSALAVASSLPRLAPAPVVFLSQSSRCCKTRICKKCQNQRTLAAAPAVGAAIVGTPTASPNQHVTNTRNDSVASNSCYNRDITASKNTVPY